MRHNQVLHCPQLNSLSGQRSFQPNVVSERHNLQAAQARAIMMRTTFFLLSTLVVSTEALSCAYPPGGFSLNNALHSADVVVVARVWNDITPKPTPVKPQEIQVNMGNATHPVYVTQIIQPPVIAGYTEPKYYTGYFRNVLSGDYETGRVIIKAGQPCGISQLQEKTTYLLFGSIQYQKVKGKSTRQMPTARADN